MIENLEQIEIVGIRQFVRNENARWACPVCGDLICVHRPSCLKCDTKRNAEQITKADAWWAGAKK